MTAEKLRIYLDTNVVYGLFKRILQAIFEGREFKIPRKIGFIHKNLDKIEPYTSFFMLIEVVQEVKKWLRKKKIKMNKAQIQALLGFFKDNFQIEILRIVEITDKTLDYFLDGIQWKDAIQLDITKNNDFTLITDDINLRGIGRRHYTDILNFEELINKVKMRTD